MNPISIDELSHRFGSRFDLVVAAAKRAGQIKDGAPPLVETTARNPLTIALEEIAAGKVLLRPATEEMMREPEPVVQDYLVRRGSLQDQIATYAIVDEDDEDLEDEYEDEGLEEDAEEELDETFAEEYEEEEAEFEFGFGGEPDQLFPEDLEEEAEDLEEAYLDEGEEEDEDEAVEEDEED